MATEKLKINYKVQNKTWTNQQIKNHKNSHELSVIRSRKRQKSRTLVLKFLTPLTLSVEKIVKIHGFKYKPRNINALFSQGGSQWHGSASHISPEVAVKCFKKCIHQMQ